ncbi:MAG: DUF2812 domain-containing protein [Oscillospiraceae bacterium]|nr:DUF2812 domain-containing protein [Oscillospiraceae bacterium]
MVIIKNIGAWDPDRVADFFEKKASEGIFVKSMDGLFMVFKKKQPRNLKYYAEYAYKRPNAAKKELYKQAGWEYVTYGDNYCIWCSEDMNAVEPHTDKAEYSKMMRPVYTKLIGYSLVCAILVIMYVYLNAISVNNYLFSEYIAFSYKYGLFHMEEDYRYMTLFNDYGIYSNGDQTMKNTAVIAIIVVLLEIICVIFSTYRCVRIKNKLAELSKGEYKLTVFQKLMTGLVGIAFLGAAVIFVSGLDHSKNSSTATAENASDSYALIEEFGGIVTEEDLLVDEYSVVEEDVSFTLTKTAYGTKGEYISLVKPAGDTEVLYRYNSETGERMTDTMYTRTEHYYADDEENAKGIFDTGFGHSGFIDNEDHTEENVASDYFDRVVYYTQKSGAELYDINDEPVEIYSNVIFVMKGNKAAKYRFESRERIENCQQIVDNIEEKWSEISA